MNKVVKIISDIIFVVGLFVAGFVLVGKFTGFTPFKVFIVSSGSMEPSLKTGSIVVTVPQKEYKTADIVTFHSGTDKKATTTHRIVGIGGGVIKTAGDANNQPDTALVNTGKIVGRVVLSVPYLGYLAGFAQTPRGFILLVIVPATIIIYEEIKGLIWEIKKEFHHKKSKGHADMQQIASQPDAGNDQAARSAFANVEWPIKIRPALIIPVFCAAFILSLSFSLAYFSDTESSSQNSFTAWVEAPPQATPTPGPANHIVFSEIQIKGANANQDFVELYNPTSTDQLLTDWKIRVKNNRCNESSLVAIPSGKTILAHSYFLWARNSEDGYPGSIGADASTSASLSENNSLALKNDTNVIIDQVGWGNANCANPADTPFFESAVYPDINNDIKSIERKAYWNSTAVDMISGGAHETKGNGYDSDNNSTDFISRTTGSQPQNSTSPIEIP